MADFVRGKQNVYQALVSEFEQMITLGGFSEGEKLPSVRSVAMERGINPNTVEKAYIALEEKGLIEIVPKKGAYVLAGVSKTARLSSVKNRIEDIKNSGISKAEVLKIIDEVYK